MVATAAVAGAVVAVAVRRSTSAEPELVHATNALAVAHYEAKGPDDPAADALACLEARCGLKSVDSAYDAFDNKEPWDEVLS